MKIAIINPNSTSAMTEKCRLVAEKYKQTNTEIFASNPQDSPASIEGHFDKVMSLPCLINEVEKAKQWGADGYLIACFDDPGLAAIRELVIGPVIGICEAAMHAASIVAYSFSVITTLPRSVPIIEELAYRYGMNKFVKKIRSANIPVLALEDPNSGARKMVKAEILKAIQEDQCEAIILGCAGMADLALALSEECKIPVIDGVLVGFKLCEALVGANIKTSKINAYSFPRKK